MTATLAGLQAAIHNAPDLENGLCVGQWDLWDETEDHTLTQQAIQLCGQCKVLQSCTDWSATLSDRQISGVVAGVVRHHRSGRKGRTVGAA